MNHKHRFSLLKLVPILLVILMYIFVPPPQGLTPNGWKALIIFLIALYLWATGIINISITALFVIFMLMFTNAVTPTQALSGFSSPAVFLVIVGFLISLGLVASGLDKRIANQFLKYCVKEKFVLLGVIFITAFLSMLMSNTAITLVMLPITARIAKKLNMNKVILFLIIAFAANIGGVGFLIGTAPNLIAAEALNLDFNQWFVIGFPFMLIMLILLYFSLYLYLKPSSKYIKIKTDKPGPISKKEKIVASIILLSLVLWFTSPYHGISTITIGLLAGLLLLLTTYSWNFFQKNTDWGVLFLLGGAISLGHALESTGAANWLAQSFLTLTGLQNPLFISFGFVLFSLFITQFIQNTATTAIMTPVLIGLSETLNISPKGLVIPMAIGVSMTFLLPTGTAPNAIVFNATKIKVKEMVKLGVLPTILAIICLFGLCWVLV